MILLDNKFIMVILLIFSFFTISIAGIFDLTSDTILTEFLTKNCHGKIIAQKSWSDKNGKFRLIICKNDIGQFGENNYKSELNIKIFKKTENGYKEVWKLYDFAPNQLSSLDFFEETLEISDINNDSVADVSFFYEINPDGLDPSSLKFMIYTGHKKLALRGEIPKDKMYLSDYKKEFDKSFDTESALFRQYASQKWDTFVTNHYHIFLKQKK
jgi:hypothetical protein